MITIIHGDDIVRSRDMLTRLKKQFPQHELFQLTGENASLTDIVQVFESQSLFAKKKLLILEGFIETKDKKLVALVLNHLKKHLDHDVVFWEPKAIKQELLSLFPKNATIHFYKQEQLIFQFLDSIRPGNASQMLSLLHRVLQRENPELVFYMLVRQFRLLLGVSTTSAISDVKRLAPWQRSKLERQARELSLGQVKMLYQKLFQLEREAKTGTNALPLAASLDLFLSDI